MVKLVVEKHITASVNGNFCMKDRKSTRSLLSCSTGADPVGDSHHGTLTCVTLPRDLNGGGVVRVVVGQDVIRRRSRATVDHLILFASTTIVSIVVTAAVPSLSLSCRGPSLVG